MSAYTPMPLDGTIVSKDDGRLVIKSFYNRENSSYDCGNSVHESRMDEIIITLSEQTQILDGKDGYPVLTENLSVGDRVRVYIGLAMTMSLPPIANGVLVLWDCPVDREWPIYTDILEIIMQENGKYVLKLIDETEISADHETVLLPFLTRNIVRLEDIVPGKPILLWKDMENASRADKIVLFPEEF